MELSGQADYKCPCSFCSQVLRSLYPVILVLPVLKVLCSAGTGRLGIIYLSVAVWPSGSVSSKLMKAKCIGCFNATIFCTLEYSWLLFTYVWPKYAVMSICTWLFDCNYPQTLPPVYCYVLLHIFIYDSQNSRNDIDLPVTGQNVFLKSSKKITPFLQFFICN